MGDLLIHASGEGEGLLEFTCPSCGRLNVRPLGHPELAALTTVGAVTSPGPAPFELLEEHSGPPISWDDLIEFHEAVSALDPRTGWPRSLTGPDGRDDDPVQERDAA